MCYYLPMSETLSLITPIVAIAKDGQRRDYDLHHGYNDSVIEQLIEKSKEEGIPKRDAQIRFKDETSFHAWRQKGIGGRALYPLLDPESQELHGVVWYGIEEFPTAEYRFADPEPGSLRRLRTASTMSDTYAIRTYQSARGTGAAKPMTLNSLSHYAHMRLREPVTEHPMTGIFLETDVINLPAVQTYTNLFAEGEGFDMISRSPNGERLAMMLPLHRILQGITPGVYGNY